MFMVLGLATGGMPVSYVGLGTGGMLVSSIGLATGGVHVSSIGLATGGMPMSVGQFGYRCDSCELVALGYSWVTLVHYHA
jgi:hypothetical protein